MRILVENSAYKLTNLGDHAMLNFGLRRLRSLFPGAELHVLTSAPERLHEIAPDAIPYHSSDRKAWCRQRLIPRWPRRVAFADRWNHSRYDSVGRLKRPMFWESVHNATSWWADQESQAAQQFVDFLKTVDLVVSTGSGGINDEFSYHAVMVLLMLHLARSLEIPVAMFGQGLGPVADVHLRSVMQQILPQVNLIALREGRHGLPLAESVGVPREKLLVTGDDGIEIAYENRSEKIGSAVGLNIRKTDYSQVNGQTIDELGEVISAALKQRDAACVPLPIRIADDAASDLEATKPVLNRCAKVVDIPAPISRPVELLPIIAQCRCVVTGSYHAGVFALAMGIPVIGLAASPYYLHKFLGLQEQFTAGCQVVDLHAPNWKESLKASLFESYDQAEKVRPTLLARAEQQINASTEAYQLLPSLLSVAAQ